MPTRPRTNQANNQVIIPFGVVLEAILQFPSDYSFYRARERRTAVLFGSKLTITFETNNKAAWLFARIYETLVRQFISEMKQTYMFDILITNHN